MRSGRLHLFFLVISPGLLWPSAPMFAGECSRHGEFYEANDYVVTKIAVYAALDIAHQVRGVAGGNELTIHARSSQPGGSDGRFNYDAFLESAAEIGNRLGIGYTVSLAFVVPRLVNCDESAKTLEVQYRVYHLGYPGVLNGTASSLRPPPIRISNNDLSQILLLQPAVGYDAARHFFGGGQMALHRKMTGAIEDFSVVGYGSSSSLQLQAQLSGRKEWSAGPLSHLDWGLAYVSNDLPAGSYAISEKQLSARLAGIGRTGSNPGLNFHFGGDFEGGNQRSIGPSVQSSIGVLRSPVGSLKLYLGSSWSHNATSLSASYGIQLGSAQSAAEVDFMKQVVNASASTRFLPTAHHPLALDSNFYAGWLTSYGAIPLAERFFGGNIPTPFIPGDAWVIQSNPILRSFPARDFTLSKGPWGGTSFFSVNTNVSYAVWGKPLVPEQVATKVKPLLQQQMKTFKAITADSYVADGQAYKALETAVSSHSASMAELRKRLQAIQSKPGTPADLSSAVGDALDDLDNVDAEMMVLGKRDVSVDALSPIFHLVVGEGTFKGYFSDLADDLSDVSNELNAVGRDDDRDYVAGVMKGLRELRESASVQFKAIDRSSAETKAEDSLKFPNHVLSELLNDLNLYSISPTLLLDAAHLGPQPSTGGTGTRYGVGPAIRFGSINVDFTVGYSFNVQERAGEPRGAAVLGLTFENLF
jgi:hypothetical protein